MKHLNLKNDNYNIHSDKGARCSRSKELEPAYLFKSGNRRGPMKLPERTFFDLASSLKLPDFFYMPIIKQIVIG